MVFAQSTKDAVKFYENKIGELGTNLKDLESIVQGKSNNLRVVEDGMPPPGQRLKFLILISYLQFCARKSLPLVQHRKHDLI